jgi:transcriptional regulator with XRE-family HTH domain
MTGADFAKWRTALGLSLTEAAALLGVSRRTIMGYLQKDDLPPVVAIACRALARDKHILAAHFVPAVARQLPHRPSAGLPSRMASPTLPAKA